MGFLAIIQLILHYLGIIGIILGVIAFIFGNSGRGWELLLGGSGFIILKYLLGIIYLGILAVIKRFKK